MAIESWEHLGRDHVDSDKVVVDFNGWELLLAWTIATTVSPELVSWRPFD